MFGTERFIGEWTNTSGGYPSTLLHGLSRRNGSGPTLYKFDTRFNDHSGYCITDPALVRQIEARHMEAEAAETEREQSEHLWELESLLYTAIVETFGVMAIVEAARRSMSDGYEKGLVNGRAAAQKDIRKALGINR